MIKTKIEAPATVCLVAINVLVFLALPLAFKQQYPSHLGALGADWGPATLSGQWWRVPWSLFIHIELVHLVANMIVLYLASRRVEQLFGTGLMLMIYFGSGATGDFAILFVHTNSISYGASGAVAGLVGALCSAYLHRGKELWQGRKWEIGLLGAVVIYTIALDVRDHAHAVHTTSLLTGLVFALFILRFGMNPLHAIIICVVFAAALVITAFYLSHRFSREIAPEVTHCYSYRNGAISNTLPKAAG